MKQDIEFVSKTLDISLMKIIPVIGLSLEDFELDRISYEKTKRIQSLVSSLEFVINTFGEDIPKAKYWLYTPNLNFGGASPRKVILSGKVDKFIRFIESAREGY